MTLPIWALMVQAAASAAAKPPQPPAALSTLIVAPATARDVVVTARPLAATERALAECLARNCPPRDDISASVAHAENQMTAGDYYGARKTLLGAKGRDARYAGELPVEVGGLLRALARMTDAVGMPRVSRINEIESFEALKKGLPANDSRVSEQQLEVGDSFAKQGDFDSAVSVYRRVARDARRRGQPFGQGWAMLRELILTSAMAQLAPSYVDVAKDSRKRLMRTTDPALAPFREAASEIVIGRAVSAEPSPPVRADANTAPPRLIFQPVIDFTQMEEVSSNLGNSDDRVQWADVGFHIAPGGTVENVVVLRHSQPLGNRWIDLVRTALTKRRYTSYPIDAMPDGIDRTERYSFGYDLILPSGSHILQRSSVGRISVLDLTPPAPASNTPRAAATN